MNIFIRPRLSKLKQPALIACLVASLAALVGCNAEVGPGLHLGGEANAQSTTLSYNLTENGCSTGEQNFSSQAAYCDGLRNQALNHGCAYDLRRQAYSDQGCGANFQESACAGACTAPNPPVVSNPAPPPVNPVSPPASPPVDERPQVQKDLEAAGIKIDVQPGAAEDYPMPGQAPFSVRLAAFWSTLATQEPFLLAHKAAFHTLYVTTFGAYSSDGKFLSLSVDMTADELSAYLDLVDQHVTWEAKTGILLDTGVDFEPFNTGDRLQAIRNILQRLDQAEVLNVLRGTVKKLEIGDYSDYELESRALTLASESLDADLNAYVAAFAPGQSFFGWADARGISTESPLQVAASPGLASDGLSLSQFSQMLGLAAAQESALAKIPNLSKKVPWIEFSDSVKLSTFAYGTLTIGIDDTVAHLSQIVSQIH